MDLGGTASFWQKVEFLNDDVKVTILNVRRESLDDPRFSSIVGDARDLREFPDQSVDIVYSNSVIEHVGSLAEQAQMAKEVRRVGKRYFVQTPNAHFPIEPHFLVPGYHFMPLNLRAFLHTKARLGWTPREPDWDRAKELAASVRLMTFAEVTALFPEAKIYRERFGGLTKSFIAYHGW